MTDPLEAGEEPANLRFLRRLVTVLAGVMIVGLVTIVALLVIRFSSVRPTPVLPDTIALPAGVGAQAITMGGNWYAVVTDDGRILIFDRLTGRLRQTVIVE